MIPSLGGRKRWSPPCLWIRYTLPGGRKTSTASRAAVPLQIQVILKIPNLLKLSDVATSIGDIITHPYSPLLTLKYPNSPLRALHGSKVRKCGGYVTKCNSQSNSHSDNNNLKAIFLFAFFQMGVGEWGELVKLLEAACCCACKAAGSSMLLCV